MDTFNEIFDLSAISTDWLWIILYAFIYLIGATTFGALIRTVTSWILPKKLHPHVLKFIKPAFMLIALPLLWVAYNNLELNEKMSIAASSVTKTILYISIFWIVYSLTDYLFSGFRKIAQKTPSKLDDQFLPILERLMRLLILTLGFLIVLQSFGLDVMSLIAGLGLGGLALALAAKDSAANFFGSLMILLDQPFNIGDWVKVGETEGTVEEIGLRSTRIRTFYNSIVVVPNSTMAVSTLDNLGKREYRRFRHIVGLTYETPRKNIEEFIEALKNWAIDNPNIVSDRVEVSVNALNNSSVDILVYVFFSVNDWSEELVEREKLILEILRLSEAHKAPVAYPTQTLHLQK